MGLKVSDRALASSKRFCQRRGYVIVHSRRWEKCKSSDLTFFSRCALNEERALGLQSFSFRVWYKRVLNEMMKPERSRAARVICRKTKQQCFILEQLKQTHNPSLEKNSNFFLIWIKFWVLLEYNGTGANTLIFDLISKRLQTITPALHLQTLFLIGRIFFCLHFR